MLDLRDVKVIDLNGAEILKEGAAYVYQDTNFGKKLVVKIIANYEDMDDWMLVAEFKKMALLSAEAQIGTVYFLAKCKLGSEEKSCYVLDFINGISLDQLLSTNNEINYELAIDLIREIATGIEKSHSYGIYHDDLHAGNIMIDKFSNVKIIDFLWHEFGLAQEERQRHDLKAFKDIVKLIVSKCRVDEQTSLKIFSVFCDKATNFKGLPKTLAGLEEMSLETSKLSLNSIALFRLFLEIVKSDYKISQILTEGWIDIPPKVLDMRPPTDGEQRDLEQREKKPYLIDTRILALNGLIKGLTKKTFVELKQLGLMDITTESMGTGDGAFWPPYKFKYQISVSPKFLRWQALLQGNFELFPAVDMPFADLLFPEK